MRINEETVLVGSKVVLVPYRREHVEKYHEWMTDEEIRQQTASEPLSIDEEYEMQTSWHLDDDKLTFIVLARPDGIAAPKYNDNSDEVTSFIEKCPMAGDVNLFLCRGQENEEKEKMEIRVDGELEVMIAEPSQRRKGLAREAIGLLIYYASTDFTPALSSHQTSVAVLPLPLSNFLVKIGIENGPSISLFESMGMKKYKVSDVWQEVELRSDGASGLYSIPPESVLHWQR